MAHNYCMYHTRHHSFPDTDPRDVRDRLDALRERLQAHAQLEKHEALAMLLDRFERLEWRSEVPDVRSRVLLLYRTEPARRLPDVRKDDAEAAVGGEDAARLEDDGDAFARSAASITSASDSEPESVQDDAASASTLSDFEDEPGATTTTTTPASPSRQARPGAHGVHAPASSELERGVAARRAALVASAELAREKEKREAAGNPRDCVFRVRLALRSRRRMPRGRPRAAKRPGRRRGSVGTGATAAAARTRGSATSRRSGVGAAVVEAAGVCSSTSRRRGALRPRRRQAPRRGPRAKASVGSRRSTVGAALDALRGDAAPGAGTSGGAEDHRSTRRRCARRRTARGRRGVA